MNAVDDLESKSGGELEDILMELCGRPELGDTDVDLLYRVEHELERRQRGED